MGENKQTWSDFIQKDRFELHSYLTYLFNQCHDESPRQLEDENNGGDLTFLIQMNRSSIAVINLF
ncbi:hypothetical protein ACLHDF_24345 [Priestia aryabhattai]|uniref:hypothetical protein n=1 Tax=Priestia megaterium TaxID=1404 RepID=UPI0039B8D712